MNVNRIEKVANGWVAYDEHNTVIAVATNSEQLMKILDITPCSEHDSVYLTMNPDFNFNYFWHEMVVGNKIEAIKAFRNAFEGDHRDQVSVGLKLAKDFVEGIMTKINCEDEDE